MKSFFKYIRPHLKYFILGPVCMIIEVLGEILMPTFLAEIINRGAEEGWVFSIKTAFLMILVALMMMAGGVGGAYFGGKASVNFASDLRQDIYKKVQEFSFNNIDKFSTGSLVTRLTADVTSLQNFVNMILRMFLRAPGMLIGGLIMAIRLRPDLATVLSVTIPLMIISVAFIIRRGFPRFQKMQEKLDNLNSTVQENITNVRVVKSFVREDYEIEKFSNSNKALKSANMQAMSVMIFMQPVMTVFMNFTTLAVLYFGGKMVLDLNFPMPVGDLSAFINYVTQILSSLMILTVMLMHSSRALASAKRIKEVLKEKVDIDDNEAKCKDKVVTRGEIEFKNATYRYYKDSEEKVISSVNLKIEEGMTVGIIGSTGCGKTTLVSMIPRLYDLDEGVCLVDGVDVKDYSLKNLRSGIGMVLQKNVLFSGTIKDNLLWGDENASFDDIKKAAALSMADGFVESFNDGYDTVLEQGGVNVSGGQKQRLCIARTLLKKPKILILDDSTSAVDTATEAKIKESFKNYLEGSTKIIIAQRISSVKDADMIVVMDEGRITGTGSHEELLENNEEYREIYLSQSTKEVK